MIKSSKRRLWPQKTKQEAVTLRKKGLTYSEIKSKLGIPKSTLFEIFKPLNLNGYTPLFNRYEHIRNIQFLAIEKIKKNRQDRLDNIKSLVKKETDSYPFFNNKKYLRSLLAMLYWAEGAKTRGALVFTNTDPNLSLLFLTLLRKCYSIDEDKIRVRLYLHYYHPIKTTKKYWSNLLKIPLTKFTKIYIKKRSKTKRFRKNFAGICIIKYHSDALRYEILELGKALASKICAHSSIG